MYKPYIARYTTSAKEAIESGWISNLGPNVKKATKLLADTIGTPYCLLMANGTCATHCLFLALRFKNPGIERIYVPNNVYVAVWNCALMEYEKSDLKVLPMNEKTWNADMSEEVLLGLKPNSAMIIVHNVGNVIDVNRVHQIRPDIVLIEDNCEGLFGQYADGSKTGSSKVLLGSSCSFYGNKTITTGEGGAFLTHHQDVYDHIKRVYSQGMSDRRYVHDVHAFNYRMTNVQAGFLVDQLEDINHILHQKSMVWDHYCAFLEDLILEGKVNLPNRDPGVKRAEWMFCIQIPCLIDHEFEDVCKLFREKHRVDVRPFFYPIGSHAHLADLDPKIDDAASWILNESVIMLPSYPGMTADQIGRVCRAVREFF